MFNYSSALVKYAIWDTYAVAMLLIVLGVKVLCFHNADTANFMLLESWKSSIPSWTQFGSPKCL